MTSADHALDAHRNGHARATAVLVDDLAVLAVPAVRGPEGRLRLDLAVADLYADLRVGPLVARLLACTRSLLGTVAGSVCLVDLPRRRYTTIADDGVPNRLGQGLLLEEVTTGQVFARQSPLVVDDCALLPGVDLPPAHPSRHGSAAVAPLWWQGEVVGVNVAFAGRRRRFADDELDDLELLTQAVAPAFVRAAGVDPSAVGLIGTRPCAGGHAAPPPADACPLTQREEEVLRLLADGLSDREVAARLVISHKTVQKHVGAVLRKSGTTSRTAAVVQALRRGWLG